MNVVLIGAPGTGKGTQGDLLKVDFNLLKISLGDILREYRKDEQNPLSQQINSLLDTGKLLPDEVINKVAQDFVEKHTPHLRGLMFDGYPRSIGQAEFLDKMLLEKGEKIDKAIMLDVKLDDLISRLQNRYTCKGCGAIYNSKTNATSVEGVCDVCGGLDFSIRKDDGEIGVIQTRFEEFHAKTMPVIGYYENQGKLEKIDAKGDIEKVYSDIIKAVKGV
ncbi:adenylate kinase family protein [Candidatus Deianiraea vastatrix]|uniref:Adenylate kinase n=1 Tax=Candidatus Deianiraea vastatrix TaxID=2163644 RepID=A0A5B8XGQ9_9RICK|nr:nucleoside monophosphate kinase [Candidatus Deianiraea vastatrix]QED23087.1 Adenylate kinase [Candidatus Deianiraea vastatrix]